MTEPYHKTLRDKELINTSKWKVSVIARRGRAIDSTTIQLVANCIDWAKHRRRKAAAKCHMQLNLQTFLPQFAIVKEASTHDSTEAYRLCANLKSGEIAVFDKAYVDFMHLADLDRRGVFWVTRAKDNMRYRIVKQLSKPKGAILNDVLIELETPKSHAAYPQRLRLVTANVEVNGVIKTMTFITNNTTWAATRGRFGSVKGYEWACYGWRRDRSFCQVG